MRKIHVGLALFILVGACQAKREQQAPAQAAPLPIAEISEAVQRELNQMQKIYDLRGQSGRLLAQMNAKMQSRGFSRRVPSGPVAQALESDLRTHAAGMGLLVNAWSYSVPERAPVPTKGVNIAPHERWNLSSDQIEGKVSAKMALSGPRAKIVAFIDRLPQSVERAVWVRGATAGPGSGVTLELEAYYERHYPAPSVTLRWPSLEARLRAAGHDPEDARLRRDPAWERLVERDKMGRSRVPSLRSAIAVSSDFPRWFAKAAMFDRISARVTAVTGEGVLQGLLLNGG